MNKKIRQIPASGKIPGYIAGCPPGTILLVSFSGGRTSAYMARRLQLELADHFNLFFVFANTGQEREETLEFVDQCDREYGWGVVWVEAVIDPQHGNGTRHKVVSFHTASRAGEPFEEMIKKYGIPNKSYPHCTRELKEHAINSYAATLGVDYKTAIGIRADEYRRVNDKAVARNIIYPLVDIWCVDKTEVNRFWKQQPFTLHLKEHEGNCAWCWKKSLRKHLRLINERPKIFDFPRRMEQTYPMAGASGQKQVFFRGHRSTDDLFGMVRVQLNLFDMDLDDGCSESCEMYQAI
jgi:hypothetical protein